jgi:hypothetical protein
MNVTHKDAPTTNQNTVQPIPVRPPAPSAIGKIPPPPPPKSEVPPRPDIGVGIGGPFYRPN